MATIKQLEETVNELQEQVSALTKQMEALSTLGNRVARMRDTVEDLSRDHLSSNKRIQSDIQRIVERISNTPTRIL
jgi:prefoldin subunit 5